MIICKITEGFVVQTFDTETRKFTDQEFVACDDVQYERDSEPVDADLMQDDKGNEPYLPFHMKQPESE